MSNSRPGLRVIYIGGVEHSGSTFLGVTLGNHPQIECVGELTALAREGWCGDYLCACGLSIGECSFWQDVRKVWTDRGDNDVEALTELEEAFDKNRRLPRLMMERRFPSASSSKYCEAMYDLFWAIRQTSGSTVVVDTSKRFARALALSMADGLDLRLIHLVRDSRGVAYSFSKPVRLRRRPWWFSALRWNLVNMGFEQVRRDIGDERVIRVRYEDLILEPVKTLEQIGEFVDVDLGSLPVQVARGEPLAIGHVGIGNHFLRNIDEVRMRSTIDWPQKLPESTRRKVWWATGRLMRRYGYER